ncbi:MAG: response regulator [Deltaproteobacteria bacterium]|nr:response regulator [Deltaproteobacteria bacterium]
MALRRARVLVAEDDDAMRAMLTEEFQRRGFEVVTVKTGRELWHQLSHAAQTDDLHRPFDAVVSDVRMPGRTGLDVLAELRESNWSVPVFLITGFGEDWIHREGDRLGASVLDKPVDLDRLVCAVREATAA